MSRQVMECSGFRMRIAVFKIEEGSLRDAVNRKMTELGGEERAKSTLAAPSQFSQAQV